MFYVITNQGLLQPAPGMEGCCVSKCLLVPENGMNIELFVVNYSDFDFSEIKYKRTLEFPCVSKKSLGFEWFRECQTPLLQMYPFFRFSLSLTQNLKCKSRNHSKPTTNVRLYLIFIILY